MSFPVTINGNTYNEADFLNYGHVEKFPEIIADVAASAQQVADDLSTSQTLLSSQGLTGTSTTSNTIGTGSMSFTIETGKGFVAGTGIKIIDDASAANYMLAEVTSYNSGTGALVVNVTDAEGSGTISDWNIIPWQAAIPVLSSSTTTGIATFADADGNQLASSAHWKITSGGSFTGSGKSMWRVAMQSAGDTSIGTGTHTIDFDDGDYAGEITATGNFTLATDDFPSADPSVTLFKATNWGAHTITLDAGIEFADGVAPEFTASGTDLCYLFIDEDGVETIGVIAKNLGTV